MIVLNEEDVRIRQILMDHSTNPRYFGELNEKCIMVDESIPGYGNHLILYMNKDETKKINAKFVGKGSTLFIASTSLILEYINGKSIDEANKLDINYLCRILGKKIVYSRIKCSSLPFIALTKALELLKDGS